MKGVHLTVGTVIALVIAVIVIAIALYFLIFARPFDPYFLSPDKEKLIKYATCSLALCSNGYDSPQVEKLGCLYSQGGSCVETCKEVGERLQTTYQTGDPSTRLCGEENAIEFSLDSVESQISLSSGEILDSVIPRWVCRGTSVFGERLRYSDGAESMNGGCVMLGTLKGTPKVFTWKEDTLEGELCFSGYNDVSFTPLMPLDETEESKIIPDERVYYPSALYFSNDVLGSLVQCSISNGGPVLKDHGDVRNLRTFSSCLISSTEVTTKYKVWSKHIKEIDAYTINNAFLPLTLDPVNPISPHCAAVVFDRAFSLFETGVPFALTENQLLFPELIEYDGKLFLYFQRSHGLRGDYTPNPAEKIPSAISYSESSDGASFSDPEDLTLPSFDFATSYTPQYAHPSIVVIDGHRYIAYAINVGPEVGFFLGKERTYEIRVVDLETEKQFRVTDDSVDQFGPSIVFFEGSPYIFYFETDQGRSDIYYKKGEMSGNDITWPSGKGVRMPDLLDTKVDRYFPSATVTPDGIFLAYTYSFGDPQGSGGIQFVGTAVFDGDSWRNTGNIESILSNEFPRIIQIGEDTYVFFSRGTGDIGNPSEMSRKMMYSKYLGGTGWSAPLNVFPSSPSVEINSDQIVFGERVLMAYSEHRGSDPWIRVANSVNTVESFDEGSGS